MTRNDLLLFRRHALPFILPGARVLEIGPDDHPSSLAALVATPVDAWDTLDLATPGDPRLTFAVSDPYCYPIPDGAYDVVLSANVIEHVPQIWTWMGELARICRSGGHVITLNPVSWHYHEAPEDCWRIYPAGMRALSEAAGLEVELSVWGSPDLERLERATPRRWVPKQLWQRLSGVLVMLNAITKVTPEGAYSTITVARKPG